MCPKASCFTLTFPPGLPSFVFLFDLPHSPLDFRFFRFCSEAATSWAGVVRCTCSVQGSDSAQLSPCFPFGPFLVDASQANELPQLTLSFE